MAPDEQDVEVQIYGIHTLQTHHTTAHPPGGSTPFYAVVNTDGCTWTVRNKEGNLVAKIIVRVLRGTTMEETVNNVVQLLELKYGN